MMLSLVFVVTILTACAVESDAEQDVEVTNPRLYYMSNHDRMAILVDDETGVNYIYYGYYGGITPRLNADGSLYVSEVNPKGN